MRAALTTDIVLSLTTVGVSGLATGGTLIALKATRREKNRVAIGAIVASAPYRRLHNVVYTHGV